MNKPFKIHYSALVNASQLADKNTFTVRTRIYDLLWFRSKALTRASTTYSKYSMRKYIQHYSCKMYSLSGKHKLFQQQIFKLCEDILSEVANGMNGKYISQQKRFYRLQEQWRLSDVSIDITFHLARCKGHLPPGQNGHHFADDIFICIFVNEKICTLITIPWNFVPMCPIDNIPA